MSTAAKSHEIPRERPILMSASMVRSLLNGTKKQTRRLAKTYAHEASCTGHFVKLSRDRSIETDERAIPFCPYGEPSDRLWVRETWSPDHAKFYPHFPVVYRAGGYPADWEIEDGRVFSPEGNAWCSFRWRPSIHMPRWASRITLEITGVRVERLTKISSEDAMAEGFGGYGEFLEAFYEINKGRITYADDPWVWAISFRRTKP